MNPDFDDYESMVADREQDAAPRPWPKLILALAVVGFLMLAWYAYNSGSQSMSQETLPIVTADSSPLREEPVDRGGEAFPNKDKTIYDAISPYTPEQTKKVEKLLPEPEEPVKPKALSTTPSGATTWVKGQAEDEAAVAAAIAEDEDPAERKVNAVTQEVAKSVALPVEDPVVKREMASAMLKQLVAEESYSATPREVVPPAPSPAPAKPPVVKKPPVTAVQPMVVKPVTDGAYKVQLGAYKSDAEAQKEWQRIARSHGEVLGERPHMIYRADIPGKGTFYRLRVGGFATPDVAKATCAALAQRKQACMYVGK